MTELERIDAFVRDLESVPDVVERAIDTGWMADALRLATSRQFRFILLAGLGSSRFALMLAEDLFHTGFARFIAEPANPDRRPPPSEELLTVAISASGRTREAVELAEASRGPGRVIAITRDAGSPLAAAADAVAVLPVDAESSGVACTSFVATVVALFHLGLGLKGQGVGERLGSVPDATREVLASRDDWLPPALEALEGVEDIAVLAPWAQRGAAEQAALHMRECPRRSAAAYETAEWLHTGIYTALPGSAVLLLDGSTADAEVEQVCLDRRVRLVRVPGPAGDGLTRSTAASLLAAELWRRVTEPRARR
ncbi:MAG TPA: SIS domain-containing protein [Candidatus Limnocylindrales bacterium]|nr:SIS domain-containing protein [Candidatus Limnocylindrales bacterium]